MKILQISDGIPPFALGGSERIALETATGLAKAGHDVSILTAAPADAFAKNIEGVSIECIRPKSTRFAHYRSVFSRQLEREVIAAIDRIRPDIIHAHGIAFQIGYRWMHAMYRCNIPVIYTAHGFMHVAYGKVTGTEMSLMWQDIKRARWQWNPLRTLLIRRALSYCARIIVVSDALKHWLETRGGTNMQTIRNGIDLSFWRPVMSMQEARAQLHLPQDTCIFLLAGRIGYDKGSSAMIHTLPENCLLIAAGEMHPSVFDALGNRVIIRKNQNAEDMRLLYAACDAAVVPSIYIDPFPTVCLEAMACARPVIATSHGGAQEAVADTQTGWIVDPLNEPMLRERLEWCRGHRQELPAFGQAARAHMEKNFSQERYLDDLMKLYRSVL